MNAYTAKRLRIALYEVSKAIRVHGDKYTFRTPTTNKFGEPLDEGSSFEISGLWHTTNSFVQKTISEATKIRSKQQPQLLCKFEDAANISNKSTLTYEGVNYIVTDIINVGNFSTIADICLEEVQYE